MANKIGRRGFLKCGAAAGAFFIPATSLFGQALPKKQLRFAIVGAGGIGVMTRDMLIKAGATVSALCDVDSFRLAAEAAKFPGIPVYSDWRELLKHSKDFDAVAVATPDHTHAIVALHAMRLKKHVYIQKPLARTFEECALIRKEQERTGVVAQMGNQHHPRGAAYLKLIESGIIGDIDDVWCWTDRPGAWWPQGMKAIPAAGDMSKSGFTKKTWDLWCGPSAYNPFSGELAPFKWRGWWDYGCGAIGDMAIHNADPAFEGLGIDLPYSVKGFCEYPATVAFPQNVKIELKFAPTPKCPKGVKFTWTNNSFAPPVPAGTHPQFKFRSNGLLFNGSKGAFEGVIFEGNPMLITTGGEYSKATKDAQREAVRLVKGMRYHDHYEEFVNAVHDNAPEKCGSRMSYAAPFTQALLLGCIALRYPGKELFFDKKTGLFTNEPSANAFLKAPSRGEFSMSDFV
jgi:predicted dehydrogenase